MSNINTHHRQREPFEPAPMIKWRFSYPMGYVDAYRATGTVAAPLLAGFTLASIIVMVTAERQPLLSEWATFAFVAAATKFVFSMQFTYCGLLYAAPPSEREAVMPRRLGEEPTPSEFAKALRVQYQDDQIQRRYFNRAGLLYNLGVAAYLSGLILVLIPVRWSAAVITAIVGVAIALLVELLWLASQIGLIARPQWLLPGYGSLRPPPKRNQPLSDQHSMNDESSQPPRDAD